MKKTSTAVEEKAERTPVGALERALAILQTFKLKQEKSIMDLAAEVDLSKSTTYRLAERLRELGFLEVNPRTGLWRLGGEVVQLGVAALQTTDLMEIAPPILHRLSETTREAVNLAVFDSDRMILVYREQGPQSVTISSRLGSHRPMHASSLGKAYMSAMEDTELSALIGKLTLNAYTDSTITDREALKREVAEIRARGYARDDSEFEATLACCAAPVFDHRGMPVAAISASGPVERVEGRTVEIGEAVRAAAREISERLGFNPAGRLGT